MKISGRENKSGFKGQKRYKICRISLFILTFIIIFLSALLSVSCGLVYYDIRENESGRKSSEQKSIEPDDAYVSDSPDSSLQAAGEKQQSADYNSNEKPVLIKTSNCAVKEIIDGDTFSIENGKRIRLIGINTPETGMYFYDEAKTVLEMMIGGKELYLEKDISEMDGYGRLLRYAYYGNLFINLEMVLRGFANSFTYPPDVKYQDRLNEAERYARTNRLGLWAISELAGSGIEVAINPDAAGDDTENINGEFVIICNTGSKDINIGGWTLKDSSINIYEFYNYVLKKGERITLFSGKGKDGKGNFYWGSQMPVWNNKHDSLYLRDKDGLLIKYISY